MDATTVKVAQSTKRVLDQFRTDNESYDQIIRKLARLVSRKDLKAQLIKAYQQMDAETLATLTAWEHASNEL